MTRGHRKKDRKRRFARIHNLTTRQRHDVRFRDEMLELAIQLTHLTQHYRPYICTISLVKSASPGIWLKARLSTVENRPTHSLKTSLTISPLKRACRHQARIVGIHKIRIVGFAPESGTRRVKSPVVLIMAGATMSSLGSRQAVAPKSIASTLAAASSCMCGRT